jgi:cation:H+ antiporter
MISLTIIALGTSLPELVTSVTATRKGEYDIAIGNVVGSNIFNIGMVIGVPVSIFGAIRTLTFNYIDIIVMIAAAVFLFVFSVKDHKIDKKEGILFLILFIIYYTYVVITGIK